MSADIKIFIEGMRLPTADEWMKEISNHGFNLFFDPTFRSNESQGFLPCKYQGENTGFEYYNESLEDTVFTVEDSPEIAGKDTCVSFCSSYEQADLASATIAAGVLAKLTNGVYWIMGNFETKEDPINMARHIVEHGIIIKNDD